MTVRLDDLLNLPESWKVVLRSVKGVYMLIHLDTGQQYIGSAYGENGFMGRWENYAANGHGGNVELKKLKRKNFVFCILQVCSSVATPDQVIELEGNWKIRLGSRIRGLNAN